MAVDIGQKSETIILIHGAGVGGWIFRNLATMLRKEGHEVHCPTFTGLGERVHLLDKGINLEMHINDIVNCIQYNGLKDVILLGHSYGGIILSAVVDRISEKVKKQIYLDTYFYENNTCIMDLLGEKKASDMLKISEEECGGLYLPKRLFGKEHPLILDMPLAPYLEKVHITGAREKVPGFFIDCLNDQGFEHISVPKERAKQTCKALGWEIFPLDSDHAPMTKSIEREKLFNIIKEIIAR